jgi:flagellar protein FliS
MIKGAKAYLQTQVSTTSQGDILIMLYSGAIKYLRQAKERIAEKDFAKKGVLISKALDVIAELDQSLNNEKGGEVAQNLHQLYFYCSTRLLRANMNMDVSIIDEIIRILEGLKDAFEEIQGGGGQQAATTAGAPAQRAPQNAASGEPSSEPSADSSAESSGAPQTPQQSAPSEHPEKSSKVSSFPDLLGQSFAGVPQGAPAAKSAPQPQANQPQAPVKPAQPAPSISGGIIPGLLDKTAKDDDESTEKRPSTFRRKNMPGTYGPSGTIK